MAPAWSPSVAGVDASPCRPMRSSIRGQQHGSSGHANGSSSGGTGDAVDFFENPGLRENAPVFAAGAAAALILQWLLQCFWWWIGGGGDGGGGGPTYTELRHMAEALRAEVNVSRRLLAECREDRAHEEATTLVEPTRTPSVDELSTTTTASGSLLGSAGVPHGGSIDAAGASHGVVDAAPPRIVYSDVSEGSSGNSSVLTPGEAQMETLVFGSWTSTSMVGLAWAVGLLLLDTGLVYFCITQELPAEVRSSLEARAAKVLAFWRGLWEPRVRVPEQPLTGVHTGGGGPGGGGDGPALTPIDPSGGALMSRRRPATHPTPAPPPPTSNLQRRDPDRAVKQRLVAWVLFCGSLGMVLFSRLLEFVANDFGWHFVEYLLMYTVVTVRVCLMILLILF